MNKIQRKMTSKILAQNFSLLVYKQAKKYRYRMTKQKNLGLVTRSPAIETSVVAFQMSGPVRVLPEMESDGLRKGT